MNSNKKVLIVAAHPDDEVLGCFGSVARLIQNGYEAYTLILSGGKASRVIVQEELAESKKKLKEESYLANTVIGIKEVFHLDFPDNAFDSIPLLEIVQKIEEIKNKIKPSIVFTHHIGDINIDHQITHKAVLTATRPIRGETVKIVYAMEVPSSTEWNSYTVSTAFIPNVFYDIKDTIDLKVDAMSKYDSELRDATHPRSLEHIKQLARVSGTKVGLEYCENFMLVRQIYE